MWVDIHSENERGDIIRLVKPLKVRFQQHSFVIHAGFECDGVSVPRFAWSLVSPCIDPRSLRAGVAHDYIYRVQPGGWSRASGIPGASRVCRRPALRLDCVEPVNARTGGVNGQ